MSTATKSFCAVDSARAGDPLAGTGAHPERNLLISWPRAKWARSLRRASDMGDALGARIDQLVADGWRVNLIHRRAQSSHHHRIFVMPERAVHDVPRAELPAFLDAFSAGRSLARWHAGHSERDLVLCCTHGRKDKCCAKFGFRRYQQIAAVVERWSLPFDVWESTHLGGCRLAASVVLLPRLRKYGRIGDHDVAPLLQSEARGQPYLPCYRGDSRLTPVQQCAEIAARMWLQARGIEAGISLSEDGATDAETRDVTFSWRCAESQGALTVTCRASSIARHDTCADFDRDAQPSLSTVWHPIAVVERGADQNALAAHTPRAADPVSPPEHR